MLLSKRVSAVRCSGSMETRTLQAAPRRASGRAILPVCVNSLAPRASTGEGTAAVVVD